MTVDQKGIPRAGMSSQNSLELPHPLATQERLICHLLEGPDVHIEKTGIMEKNSELRVQRPR